MPLRVASASIRLRSARVTCTEIISDCFSAGGFAGRPIRLPFFFLMYSIILSRCANVKPYFLLSRRLRTQIQPTRSPASHVP